jgi:hypothetical protein
MLFIEVCIADERSEVKKPAKSGWNSRILRPRNDYLKCIHQ